MKKPVPLMEMKLSNGKRLGDCTRADLDAEIAKLERKAALQADKARSIRMAIANRGASKQGGEL